MNLYPYTNFHELNLDWIIEKIKENSENLVEFVKLNTIKYANPLQWDITHQYEANTVVIDEVTGYAYLSAKPVPAGVQIDNPEYWVPVFNVFTIYEAIKTGVAYNNSNVDTSMYDIPEGALVWVNQKMFKATKPIGKGDRFTDSNTVATTVEAELRALLTKVSGHDTAIDNLQTQIDTTNNEVANVKSDVDDLTPRVTKVETDVASVNGDVSDLTTQMTEVKTDVADVRAAVTDLESAVASGVKTVKAYGAKGDGVTDDTAAIKSAVADGCALFTPGVYLISDSIDLDSASIIGTGPEKCSIVKTGVSPVIKASSRSVISGVKIGFSGSVSTTSNNEYIGLRCCTDTGYALQRTCVRNVIFDNVGTAVSDYKEPCFSVHFDTIEIRNFSFSGFSFRVVGSSGCTFTNVFIERPIGTADTGFYIGAWSNGHVITSLNIERGTYKTPFSIHGAGNTVIDQLHFEAVKIASEYSGIAVLSGSCVIHNLDYYFIDCTTPGTALVSLENATPFAGTTSGTFSTYPNKVVIDTLNCVGINNDAGGLTAATDFTVFYRRQSYKDMFTYEVHNYLYQTYKQDKALYESKYVTEWNNTDCRGKVNTPVKSADFNMAGNFQFKLDNANGLMIWFNGGWHNIAYT